MALGFVYICQRFDKWYLKSFIYLLPISHMYSAQKRILWYTLWGTWAAKLLLWLCGTQCSILSILTSFKGHDVMQNIIICMYFKDHCSALTILHWRQLSVVNDCMLHYMYAFSSKMILSLISWLKKLIQNIPIMYMICTY